MDQQNQEETKQDEKMINEDEQQNQIVQANDLPKVYLWGSAENDQMDLGEDKFDTRTGFEMSFFSLNKLEVVSVICGGLHTLALTKQGQVYSWGCSDDGILGRESTMESCKQPGLVPIDCPVDMIGTGDTHSIAANSKHSVVFFWGVYRNSSGQMGEVTKVPQRVGETDFKDKVISKILCGYNHTLFFVKKSLDDKHGEILTQGEPDSSVIGRKPTARHKVEQSLKIIGLGINHVVDVYTGAKHAFLKQIKNQTKAKGGNEIAEKILGWGLNNYGQLGLGHTQDQVLRPEEIEFFNDKEIVNIVGGDEHTLALTSDGKVYGFGRNDDGTLGLGEDYEQPAEEQHQEQKVVKKKPISKKQQKLQQQNQMIDENQDIPHVKKFKFVTYPTLIPSLKGIIDIHCGMSSSYAITKNANNDIQLYSWGDSEHYLLCNGKDDEPEFEPYQIKPAFLKNQKLLVTKSFTGQETYQFKIGGQHGAFIVVSDQYKEGFGSFDEKCLTEIDEKYLQHQNKKNTPFRTTKTSKSTKQSAQLSNASKTANNKDSQMQIEEQNSEEDQEKQEDKAQDNSKPKGGSSKQSKKGPKGKKQQKQEQVEKIDEEVEEKSPEKEEKKSDQENKDQQKEQEPQQQSEKKDKKNEESSEKEQPKQIQESSTPIKQSRGRPKSASKIKQSQQKENSASKNALKSPEKEKIVESQKKKSKSPEKSIEKNQEKLLDSPSKGMISSVQKSVKKSQQQPQQLESSEVRQTRSKTPTAASAQVQTRSHQKSPQPSPAKQSAVKQQQQSLTKQSVMKEKSKTPLKSQTKSKQQASASKQKEHESSKKQEEQDVEKNEEQQQEEEEKISEKNDEVEDEVEDLKQSKSKIIEKKSITKDQLEQKQDENQDNQQEKEDQEKVIENKQEEKKESIVSEQTVSKTSSLQNSDKIQIEEDQQQQVQKSQQQNKPSQSQQKQVSQSLSQSKQQSSSSLGKASSTKKRDYDNLTKDDDDSKLSMEELQDPLKKIKDQ